MKCKFIPATEGNLQEILDIYNHYIKTSISTFYTNPISLEKMRGKVFYEDDRCGTFIIMDEETMLGYCMLSLFNEREGYSRTGEVTIYLKPDQTKKGIGTQTIEFLENLAKEKDFHSLIAWVTLQNQASVKLMEKCGWKKCGTLKEVGVKFGSVYDDVYFQKILN